MSLPEGIILVLVLIVAYAVGKPLLASQDKRGYPREVYLLTFGDDPPSVKSAKTLAHKFGGVVATASQLQAYVTNGGSCPWAGLVAEGFIAYAPGARYHPSVINAGDPNQKNVALAPQLLFNYGVWVLGPKPEKDSAGGQNVSPFSCKYWFQPVTPALRAA